MKNKKTIILSVVIVVLLIVAVVILSKENEEKRDEFIEENSEVVSGKIKVAVCPTFYYFFDNLKDGDNIEVFKEKSTSEGLFLMEKGSVDVVISGRPLKQGETLLLSEKIGEGYDFIYKEEIVVFEEEMSEMLFYTDLEVEKVINDFKYISSKNITKIEKIEDYVERGVVITVLDNLLIGEVVHILNQDGSRVRLSRLPRVYYPKETPRKNIEHLKTKIK